MKVAICQVDGKWPNLALAKLAAWHRAQGDEVEHFMALSQYDRVYASKVFSDTPDNDYLPSSAIIGGTGYGKGSILELRSDEEAMEPDFSLWPWWDKSMGFTTRGCPRRCPFCVVPDKEGPLHVVAQFGDLWDGHSRQLVLLDNNLTAAPLEHLRGLTADARAAGVRLCHCQFDARLLTAEHAAAIVAGPFEWRLHFAFDHMADEQAVRRSISLMTAAGALPSRLTFYVLVGFDTTPAEDMHRVMLLRSLGVDPFVMRYNRSDGYQTRLSRWVNNKAAFKGMTWQQYQTRFKTPLAVATESP